MYVRRERRAARAHNYSITSTNGCKDSTTLWPLPRLSDGSPLACGDGSIYVSTFTNAASEEKLDEYITFYSLTPPTKPQQQNYHYYNWDAKKEKAKVLLAHLGCDTSRL